MFTGNALLALGVVVLAAVGGLVYALYVRKACKEFMARHGQDIETIRAGIQGLVHGLLRFQRRTRPAVAARGPVHLTDLGKRISETVSASEWAMNEATCLVDGVEQKQEFEVFATCVDHVSKAFDGDPEFRERVLAGACTHATDTESVLKVHQVELRDELLRLIRQDGPVP